jgi:hypothetical protein
MYSRSGERRSNQRAIKPVEIVRVPAGFYISISASWGGGGHKFPSINRTEEKNIKEDRGGGWSEPHKADQRPNSWTK